jgi:hypothetical protein
MVIPNFDRVFYGLDGLSRNLAQMCHSLREYLRNPFAGLPENQEKHAFFDPLFQKVGQNKDFSTKLFAICIDL